MRRRFSPLRVVAACCLIAGAAATLIAFSGPGATADSPGKSGAGHGGHVDQPDSHAPPGAPANWLPREDWVMSHWLPYDHRILLDELDLEFAALPSLIDETHDEVSLADLARERGVRPRALGRRLLEPWRGRVSARRLELLRRRIRATLTQPHLASHMFGHIFHVGALNGAIDRLYGVSTAELGELRRSGHSFYEIAAANGKGRAEHRRAVTSILRTTMRRGVRERATPRSWARFWLGYQLARVDHYLSYEPG